MLRFSSSLFEVILFAKHDVSLFPVSRIHLGHSIAFIALVSWILQIITGFFLLGLLAWDLDANFVQLISVSFHANYMWLLRIVHMLGANVVLFATILHFQKVLAVCSVVTPTKALIWLVGAAIFLISLGTAFSGYVVVSGNMSFWACLVILNLVSVIPALGDEIISGILGSTTVTSWSIRRFTVLHFALGIAAILLIVVHLILLHRTVPSKSTADTGISDTSETLSVVIAKDLIATIGILGFVFLDSTKSLVHPDNWNSFSRIVTPAHIEPEAYFLWTFSAIKLHNGKIAGVLLQDLPDLLRLQVSLRQQFLHCNFWTHFLQF